MLCDHASYVRQHMNTCVHNMHIHNIYSVIDTISSGNVICIIICIILNSGDNNVGF